MRAGRPGEPNSDATFSPAGWVVLQPQGKLLHPPNSQGVRIPFPVRITTWNVAGFKHPLPKALEQPLPNTAVRNGYMYEEKLDLKSNF